MYGKKNGPSFDAFDGIQLTNGKLRMFCHIGLETGKITADAAGFVHFQVFGNIFSRTHTDRAGHVQVSGSKESLVYIGVESPFRFHEFVRMVDSDVMKGLSFS